MALSLPGTKPTREFEAAEVYRSTTVGDLGLRLARLGAEETSYEDITGRPNLYFYLIRWVTSSVAGQTWQGQVASSDREAPAPPQAITAAYEDSTVDQPFVRLTWSPSPSPDVISYEIFYPLVP